MQLTIKAAAESPKTLMFMLTAMVILIPVILGYTAYTYRLFRGKVGEEGYE